MKRVLKLTKLTAVLFTGLVMAFSMAGCTMMKEVFSEVGTNLTQGLSLFGTWKQNGTGTIYHFSAEAKADGSYIKYSNGTTQIITPTVGSERDLTIKNGSSSITYNFTIENNVLTLVQVDTGYTMTFTRQ